MKRKMISAAAALLLGVVFSGCRLLGTDSAEFSGTLETTEHALGAPAPGRLASLSVKEGQVVQKGQEIAALERYDQAKRDYERLQQLLKSGGARMQDVEHAKLAMDEQRVVSPVDGVVLLKVRETGEVLGAGEPIVTVGEMSDLWMRVYVPENLVGRVRLGDRARVRLDGSGKDWDAHVSFLAPQTEFTPRNVQTEEERVTQTFAVKVRLDEPAGLRPGVFGSVRLELRDR